MACNIAASVWHPETVQLCLFEYTSILTLILLKVKKNMSEIKKKEDIKWITNEPLS